MMYSKGCLNLVLAYEIGVKELLVSILQVIYPFKFNLLILIEIWQFNLIFKIKQNLKLIWN